MNSGFCAKPCIPEAVHGANKIIGFNFLPP